MQDCDIINEVPERLELSDKSKNDLEGKCKNPIFIKIDSFEKNYVFLDLEGRVFTNGTK